MDQKNYPSVPRDHLRRSLRRAAGGGCFPCPVCSDCRGGAAICRIVRRAPRRRCCSACHSPPAGPHCFCCYQRPSLARQHCPPTPSAPTTGSSRRNSWRARSVGCDIKAGFGVHFAQKWLQFGDENGPFILQRQLQYAQCPNLFLGLRVQQN